MRFFINILSLSKDDTSEADMLEQPTMTRTTRSGAVIRGNSTSPQQRGRVSRGSHRGINRIQPIIWNQEGQQVQMMGGEQGVTKNTQKALKGEAVKTS